MGHKGSTAGKPWNGPSARPARKYLSSKGGEVESLVESMDFTPDVFFFDVAQAQNVFTLPSEDEMESITNMWTALLPRNRAHFDGFKAYSRKEILKDM